METQKRTRKKTQKDAQQALEKDMYLLRLAYLKKILPAKPILTMEILTGKKIGSKEERQRYYNAWTGRVRNTDILQELEDFAKKHYLKKP